MGWPFLDVETPFGMAHRGGRGSAPENTEAAFANAAALGYRYFETDVHRTVDGVLVAFHDAALPPGLVVQGRIAELTWGELGEVDLGGGHHVPAMAELFDAFPDARFNIDPKADDAVDPLVDLIASRDALDRVCIGSFAERRVARARRALGPGLCTSPGPRGLTRVLGAATTGSSWQPPYGCLQIPPRFGPLTLSSAGLIERFHRLGLQVHYWTINDRAEMERLLDAGADAIISDEIELLSEVLAERGR